MLVVLYELCLVFDITSNVHRPVIKVIRLNQYTILIIHVAYVTNECSVSIAYFLLSHYHKTESWGRETLSSLIQSNSFLNQGVLNKNV